MFFFPIVVLAAVMNPLRTGWAREILKEDYQLKRGEIWKYFEKCVKEWVAFPFCVLGAVLLGMYRLTIPLENFRQAREGVERRFKRR